MPGRVNFAFNLSIEGEVSISTFEKIPINSEVFAESEKRGVLTETGEIKSGELTVKLW